MPYYPSQVPRQIEIRRRPLHAVLEDSAARHPNAIATRFFGGTLTYSQLDREANKFAHSLCGLGLEPGDRVAIHLPNCPQLLISLFGSLKAGQIVTLVNPLYEPREVTHQLNDSGARVLVTLSQKHVLRRAQTGRKETAVERLVVANIKEYFPPVLRFFFTRAREKREGHRARLDRKEGEIWFQDFIARQPKTRPETAEADPAGTALLQYTGGTTGTPKAAELTHDNLVANVAQARAWLYTMEEPRERTLMVLPLFHAYGLTCCNYTLDLASAVILLPRFDLPIVLRAIGDERPTLFPGIPAMYAAINHSLLRQQAGRGKTSIDLSSIEICISGSDRLPEEVQEEFERLSGAKLIEGYGLTEASPITHVMPLEGPHKPGSIGLPLPDTEACIELEDGNSSVGESNTEGEPAETSVGELMVRGPQVMKGYWQQPAETAGVLDSSGWLRTGDLARRDEDGFYYIVDRKKDLIISGGVNVYPAEVEEVLARHPHVSEAAVVGVPHRLKGEVVKAYVVPAEGKEPDAADIRRFAREQLAEFKVPVQVEFISELPRSTLRKVLKRELPRNEAD